VEALREALKRGHMTIVDLLMDQNQFVHPTSVSHAVKYGRLNAFQVMMKRSDGSGQGIELDRLLRLAAKRGHADIIRELAALGANVRSDDYPLRWAALGGHAAAVNVLIELGCNHRAENYVALRTAVAWGHPNVVRILVAYGSYVEDVTPEQLVAVAGVNRMIRKSGEVDTEDTLAT